MAVDRNWVADFPAFIGSENGYRLVLSEDGPGVTSNFEAAARAGACYSSASKALLPALDADLIEITLEARTDGALAVRLAPGRNCGFVTVNGEGSHPPVSIEVLPKISATNIFSLLALSGDPERFLREHSTTLAESQHASLIQLLGFAYGNALQQLVRSSGLRGLHETKSDRLPFRIRGRVNVSRYLNEYSAGRQHIFPCTYPTLTLDNRINRLLRWSLHAITSACRSSGGALALLEKLDSAFVGVRLEVVDPNTISERLPNAFDHYWGTGAIPLAKMIAQNSRLGTIGGAVRSSAVAVPMYSVFEAAFARVVAGWSRLPLERISQVEWQIFATTGPGGKAGTFIPDIVLPPRSGQLGLIADTKWKSGMDRGVENDAGAVCFRASGIKLYNADIYQMLGYMSAAQQVYGSVFVGVIVYPVADAGAADLSPLRICIGTERKPMPLYLLPWEIGTRCFERLPALWRVIEAIRSIDGVDTVRLSAMNPAPSNRLSVELQADGQMP